MGARWVLQVHASGKQPGVLLSQLCNVIEAFQADNRGRWTATVTGHRRVQEDTYSRSDRKVARDLSVVSFGNTPAALYLVLRHEKQILSADQDMSALLNRIALYKQRAMLMFEGTEYALGDFMIRICRLVLKPGEEVKGVMLDVEYFPLNSSTEAHPALQELIAALHEASADVLPDMSVVDASSADYALTENDGPQQAALLYLGCASAMAHGSQFSGDWHVARPDGFSNLSWIVLTSWILFGMDIYLPRMPLGKTTPSIKSQQNTMRKFLSTLASG